MGKLTTPGWIREGYKSKEEYERKKGIKSEKKATGKTYRVKKCPKCGSTSVSVILTGEEGRGAREWECRACKWKGRDIDDRELTEDEFLTHLDRMEGK